MGDFDGYDALSFDCYGTLIDWERGIASALRPWATRYRLAVDEEALVAAHGRHETHVQRAMPTTPYPAVLAETMRRIGAELGAAVSDEEARTYGASVGEWPPFPDSGPALAALSERYRLAILSNVDRASFARSAAALGVEFDFVVTAEDAGAYKPDPAGFRHLLAELDGLGIAPDRVLHVAESLYHDHAPAVALGLASVWIHRRHDRGGFGATHEPADAVEPRWRFPSLAAFAEAALG